MAPFHGIVFMLLGMGYLLRAEPAFDHPNQAAQRFEDEVDRMHQRTHRETTNTYFYKDPSHKVTAVIGETVLLLCRVKNLGNRTVSWIRKRDLHILTSMSETYTSDARFTIVRYPENDEWNLRIDYVQPRDTGIYECQVNMEPKIYEAVTLRVLDVRAKITGPREVYVKTGSTISLTCIVDTQDIPASNVTWYHAGVPIDFDDLRGGVSLETEKGRNGTTSKLLITRALIDDSGNYTCVSNKVAPASVLIHVLNGERPAAMQHGGTGYANRRAILFSLLLLMVRILRFNAEAVDELVMETMEHRLSAVTAYNPNQSARLCLDIGADLQKAISKKDYDRYKIVAQVNIVQRLDQSIHASFQCLWDVERDNYSYYVFQNNYIYAWCCVFGLYYE